MNEQHGIRGLLALHKRKSAVLTNYDLLQVLVGFLLVIGIVVLVFSDYILLTISGCLLLLLSASTFVLTGMAANDVFAETKKIAKSEAQKAANRWRRMADDATSMEKYAKSDAAAIRVAARLWDFAAEAADDVCSWEVLGAVINFTQHGDYGNWLKEKSGTWEQIKTDSENRADNLRSQSMSISAASNVALASQVSAKEAKSKLEASGSVTAVLEALDAWRIQSDDESIKAAADIAEKEAEKAMESAKSSQGWTAAAKAAKKAAGLAALAERYQAADKWSNSWSKIILDHLIDHDDPHM